MKERDQPIPKGDPMKWNMYQLEDFGRYRLSPHFFMRDMLYSEIASVHGMRNVPEYPERAVEAGEKLCCTLLGPLHCTFGHVSIRSAFRSRAVNECGAFPKYRNVAGTAYNFARHVWDWPDKHGIGATVSIVVPWFVGYLEERYPDPEKRPATAWKAMAWWIHDHLPFSEMQFYTDPPGFYYAAFNIQWHENEDRKLIEHRGTRETIPKWDRLEHCPGCHASEYPGFPKLNCPTERYPDPPG
ncbi:MAG: hypothetical protein OXU81_02925 [Gammaproteobacteria bacterium]|nr:hypothetical protein [Gammaproteobacteria bacterium]